MREDELVGLLFLIGLLVMLFFGFLAIIAGNIVSQLLAPLPAVAGPLGAAVALAVFIYLIIKTAGLLFG